MVECCASQEKSKSPLARRVPASATVGGALSRSSETLTATVACTVSPPADVQVIENSADCWSGSVAKLPCTSSEAGRGASPKHCSAPVATQVSTVCPAVVTSMLLAPNARLSGTLLSPSVGIESSAASASVLVPARAICAGSSVNISWSLTATAERTAVWANWGSSESRLAAHSRTTGVPTAPCTTSADARAASMRFAVGATAATLCATPC